MSKNGKRYQDAARKFDSDRLYGPSEAVELVKGLAGAGFDESVEVAVRLGVDPRKADQIVRGTVALPPGTGKEVRVAVFATGDAAAEARDAGADVVGADDLAERVQGGFLDFDVAIATPDLMPLVGPAGPHPRSPWPDAEPQDRHGHHRRRQDGHRLQGRTGRVPHRPLRQRPRPDRQGELRGPTSSVDNLKAVVDELNRAKPAAAKGRYMRKITVASTMGPGIKVDPSRLRDEP